MKVESIVDNPYVHRRPVTGSAGFFNRTSEIRRISSRVAADRPQSVSIVGEPGIGKTSLLNWLCDPTSQAEYLDNPASYVTLLLSLGTESPQSPEAFFSLVKEVLESTDGGTMAPSYGGFNELVKLLMQEQRKLVLFCDDFGVITQNRNFPLDFFSFMRSLANSNDIGYVTTSSAPLQKLCYTQDIEESPFFNIFTTVNLESFKADESRRLVEEPAQAAGSPFGQETDWVLELGGNLPYLLQATASIAFDARANGGIQHKRLGDAAAKEVQGYLETLWNEAFSEVEQEVMRRLSNGKPIERRLEFAAEALERSGHLRKAGSSYEIAAGLFSRFVKSRSGSLLKRLFG